MRLFSMTHLIKGDFVICRNKGIYEFATYHKYTDYPLYLIPANFDTFINVVGSSSFLTDLGTDDGEDTGCFCLKE